MTVNYFYDHLDRVVKKCYNNNEDTAFLYLYNGLGALSSVTDTATQEKISYVYDTVGRPSETRTEKGDNIFRVLYGYDEISRPNSLIYKYNGAYTQKYSTSYIADNRITLFKLNNGQSDVFSIAPTFDTLGRQTSRTLKNGSGAQVDKEVYSFLVGAGGANASTSMVSSVGYYGSDSTVDETYTYTYDNLGNIKTVSKNGTQIAAYTYNSFNMLTGYTDADGNTYTYGYSSGKNISETGKYLLFYTDDVWLDRVTCITDDASGKVFGITYDGIGNTLSYRDGMSFTWKNGRQLATFTQGQTSASYDYNENGIRNKKTVNGITTSYILAGSTIVSENRNGNFIQYYYNEAGSVIGLRYNGNDYFFRRTVNGDIIAILNTSGEVVVTYEYDPWGNILSTSGSLASTLGVANPFRYRGYYYDTESGLYYLQTRYYDPAVGRFINADGFTSTGQGLLGNNMYAYCLNNPISFADSLGAVPEAVTSKKIHDAVLRRICGKDPNLSMEDTYTLYNGYDRIDGYGFCDLYNKETGEVWELKKASLSRSCLTEMALGQLTRYINGSIKGMRNNVHPSFPKTHIPGEKFRYPETNPIYEVEYWDEGNGILRYSYTKITDQNKQTDYSYGYLSVPKTTTDKILKPDPVAVGIGMCIGGGMIILSYVQLRMYCKK